jgi:hypothetical protein
MKVQFLFIPAICLSITSFGQVKIISSGKRINKVSDAPDYFNMHLKPGGHLGTVFMRTQSVTGEGFTSLANRISGTGDYTVKSSNADSSLFDAVFTIDGYPPSTPKITIKDSGRTIGFSGKNNLNREASGLAYNPFIWGTYKGVPKKGDKWTVTMDHPWELGGIGKQLVTVIFADPKSGTIFLKRDGSGEGLYDNEKDEMVIKKNNEPIKVRITAGKGHWTGYTLIQRGIVVSDELMAVRPVTLVSKDTTYNAVQREYIMLNSTLLPND